MLKKIEDNFFLRKIEDNLTSINYNCSTLGWARFGSR